MPTTAVFKEANQRIKLLAKDSTVFYGATINDPLHLREDQRGSLAYLENLSYEIKIIVRWDSRQQPTYKNVHFLKILDSNENRRSCSGSPNFGNKKRKASGSISDNEVHV